MFKEHIEKKLVKYLSNTNHKKILLALSGGIDSVVLFNILNLFKNKYLFELYALHVNYKHNKNADMSEVFCKNLAKSYNCTFISITSQKFNNNFEHNARIFRYQKLKKYAFKKNIHIIMTAHHFDDQIETIYMNTINNSDWVSKIGIREEYGKIKRPMLDVTKKNIYKYANDNNLKFIKDSTNIDTKYLRNDIRINKIPMEKEKNLNFINEILKIRRESINKMKKFNKKLTIYNDSYFIDNRKYYLKISNDINTLDIITFKLYYQYLFKKYFNEDFRSSNKNWNQIKKKLRFSKIGAIIYHSNSYIIIKDRSEHFVVKQEYYNNLRKNHKKSREKLSKLPFKWKTILFNDKNIEKTNFLILPGDLYDQGKLYLRNWIAGDKCYSSYYKKNVKLKKLFINNKISIIDKHAFPVIVNNKDEIINVPNVYNREINKNNQKVIYWEQT